VKADENLQSLTLNIDENEKSMSRRISSTKETIVKRGLASNQLLFLFPIVTIPGVLPARVKSAMQVDYAVRAMHVMRHMRRVTLCPDVMNRPSCGTRLRTRHAPMLK
jgi:hypothetical protein